MLRTLVLVIAMLAAAGISVALTPKPLYSVDHKPDVKLNDLFPHEFAGWQSDYGMQESVISPDARASLARYYTDTLSRIYTNASGDRVMFSLAYGADQGRAMQVHKPEVCYQGQGFKISDSHKDDVKVEAGGIPVMRLMARQGPREEPITYWIRSGDDVIRGWLEQNVSRVKAGFKGHLPDGILVRVSTIDADAQQAYAVQDRFIADMLPALSPAARKMILGEHFEAP